MSATAPALESAGQRMTRALAELGVITHTDDDAGNSWLHINLAGVDFPGVDVPKLTVYVYDEHEDTMFVKEPLEHWAGTWRVLFEDGARYEVLFRGRRTWTSSPESETAECVAFITDFLTKPRA